MTEFQEKLLQTFKVFAEFCKENDLTYYAAYGTCLGAVRHNGFIPWDDDMDVYMLRADYERMLSLRDQLYGSIYWVSDFRDGNHPYPFAKFYSTDCSVWELRQFPFIIGPWIDIFPLDEWNNSIETSKLYDDYHYSLWKYRKALSSQSWNEIWSDISHLNGYNGLIKLTKKCIYSPFKQKYLGKAFTLSQNVASVRGGELKDWNDPKKKIYQKEWFGNISIIPFEDTDIMCPSGYHELLSYEYGDYMVPPPEGKRRGGHPCYYKDLNSKKSIKDILEDLKKSGGLTRTEAKPLSFKVLLNELIHRKGF